MKKKPPKPSPADKAFTQPEKSTLDDLTLGPWTPDRILAFQSLGGLYPNLGKEGHAQFKKTSVYPGAARDVILFVFLSQCPPEEVDEATWPEAKVFGVKRKLHDTNSTAFWQAYAKFIEVQNEISASIAVPNGSEPPDDDEEEHSPKD